MQLPKLKICRVVIGCVIAFVSAIAITERVVVFKVNQITHPIHADQYTMMDDAGQPFQQVALRTSDGLKLIGWYIPPQNGATIILQHGYSANSADVAGSPYAETPRIWRIGI